MSGRVFGTWDAPATDDDIPVPAPVGQKCMYCDEEIQEGDNGRIQENGLVIHRECSLRMVFGGIGHHIDHNRYCIEMSDPDAGLSPRTSSLLVWNWWQLTNGGRITDAQREHWRLVLRLLTEGKN